MVLGKHSFQVIDISCLVDTVAGSASTLDWTHHEDSDHTGRTADDLYLLPTSDAGVGDCLFCLVPEALVLIRCRTLAES